MSDLITIRVNGCVARAMAGQSVATALMASGLDEFRRSPGGEPRGPMCAMGICHECRVTIDGVPHRRACMVSVVDGMNIITTGEAE